MCHLDPSVNNSTKNSVLREGTGEERPTISRRHNKEVINKYSLWHAGSWEVLQKKRKIRAGEGELAEWG